MINQKGFTLVELLAVMIIVGIMLAIAVPKIINVNKNAEDKGIKMAIVDLNGREMKAWTDTKFKGNYTDQDVFDHCDYKFTSTGYEWISIESSGGTLRFKETTVKIDRHSSTMYQPAKWSLQ